MLTICNLPDEVHRALHGRSAKAEVREILAVAVRPESRVRLGEALTALGREIGLTNEDFRIVQQAGNRIQNKPPSFE